MSVVLTFCYLPQNEEPRVRVAWLHEVHFISRVFPKLRNIQKCPCSVLQEKEITRCQSPWPICRWRQVSLLGDLSVEHRLKDHA